MPDSITLKYTLTEDDYVGGYRAYARSKPLWWIMWGIRLMAVLALYVFLSSIAGVAGYYTFPAILALVVVYGVSFWWTSSMLPRRAARSSPFLNADIEVIASDEGLKYRSALSKGESEWAVYTGALESSAHFLLHGGKNLFYIYPKRGLTEPGDLDRFRDLLRTNVPLAKLRDSSS